MWHPALRPGLLVLFGPVGGNLVLVIVGLSFWLCDTVCILVFWKLDIPHYVAIWFIVYYYK